MFDDPIKPMTQQILEEMERQGYQKKEIDYVRTQIIDKKDLSFAMKIVQILASLEAFDILTRFDVNDSSPSPSSANLNKDK